MQAFRAPAILVFSLLQRFYKVQPFPFNSSYQQKISCFQNIAIIFQYLKKPRHSKKNTGSSIIRIIPSIPQETLPTAFTKPVLNSFLTSEPTAQPPAGLLVSPNRSWQPISRHVPKKSNWAKGRIGSTWCTGMLKAIRSRSLSPASRQPRLAMKR